MNRFAAFAVTALFVAACGKSTGATGGPGSGGGAGGAGGGPPTWYRDVQPIVQRSCQSCHTDGGIGPMPLNTYADAMAKIDKLAAAVQTRQMPPWMPADNCRPLSDSRALPQADIDTILAWYDADAPEGDPATAPANQFSGLRQLSSVDLTVDPGADFTPPAAQDNDTYRCFALGSPFTATKDVIGYDIAPGVAKEVHHVILYAAAASDIATADATDPELGWPCYGGSGVANSTVVGGWAPGTPATTYPATTGVRILKNEQLLMQVHYNLANNNGVGLPDRTRVKLQFSPTLVVHPATLQPVVETSFIIPPGTKAAPGTTTTTGTSPPASAPITIWGAFPHMHQLGTYIRVSLVGTDECLVDIPKWDFHWQQPYQFTQGLTVPAGTRAQVTCSWSNPENRTVTWGESTTDEMCLSYLYLTF